ncbi:tyrosinase family protein [Nitrosomonas sp. sh817]|uniref:tyrosinase family protein n=1 Tax=Nitrosomonas sp. sh817 TaxID=3070658 RepID=UPI0027DD2238|nr:tyrosinase family protein [Nitrosomonas sp. sh817]WMJ09554.1 tyrosinase family protein [Nitrosomonas sp. sh817]
MRKRKEQNSLFPNEWDAFIAALKQLRNSTSTRNYDYFTEIHTHHKHRGQAHEKYTFLPWHREYLLMFEDALVLIDPNVTLPYWNWVTNPEIPSRLADAAEWGVIRDMNAGDRISPKRKDDVELAMKKTTYAAFHDRIDGPHGAVHVQIGGYDRIARRPIGEMADIEKSPRDILFWLHHAYLDKLWHDWGEANPNEIPVDGPLPHNRVTARFLPTNSFTRTTRQVLSISDLGYEYE